MSSIHTEAGLEIDEDIHQQRQVWLIEKVSWVVMALLMLAALLGLLGHGPLSSKILDTPASGLVVRYQRFERSDAKSLIKIQLNPGQQSSQARLSIGKDFIDRVEISRIEPAPAAVELGPDHVTYIFSLANPGDAGEILVHYKPIDFGSVRVEIALGENPAQTFSQFVYP